MDRELPSQKFIASGCRPRAIRAKGGPWIGTSEKRSEYSLRRLSFSDMLLDVLQENSQSSSVERLGRVLGHATKGWTIYLRV